MGETTISELQNGVPSFDRGRLFDSAEQMANAIAQRVLNRRKQRGQTE